MILRTVKLPVTAFRRPQSNPNVMSPEDFAALQDSIRTSGFLQPILARGEPPPRAPDHLDAPDVVESLLAEEAAWLLQVEDGLVDLIDGEHRLDAALALGLKEVSAVVGNFDSHTVKLLQISMNRLRGELDLASVGKILDGLSDEGLSVQDLTSSGYSADEVTKLLESLKPEAEDLHEMGPVGAANGAEPSPETHFVLEIVLQDKKELTSTRRRLKKAGGGDVRKGLLAAIAALDD